MLRGLARWGAQEISGNPALDERYPMILINGLPFVGKSTVARELAYLLDDGNRPGLVTTLREAAFNFFGDPSPRPSKDRASASAHKRDKHHRPIEVFADGRAIVIDVEHLSLLLHAENGEHGQQPGGGHTSQSSKPDAQTASSVARYCSSLSTLTRKKPSSEAADRLDRGRRSALEEGLLHEKRSASAVIFTEYLPKYNGESGEFAAKSYRTAADVFDRRLIPVYLTCSEAEHQRRFECRQREEHQYVQAARARGVAFSENQIAAMAPAGLQQAAHALKKLHCGEEDVYYFSKPAHFVNQQFQLGPPPVFGEPTAPEAYQGVRIDSTGLTALETAMVIRDFIHDVQRGEPVTTKLLWPPTQKERERKYLEELESWVVVSRNEETNRGVEAS
ncbi:hypothetical protein SPBR_00740 [Sporothrix brasiliensis 5110]|uniref:Uncharacterized protein n=1 Tax=Sporothrix brasiliensis 5110 TaxID=1398154 RepID=A0A0C2IME9_9PEZI|nr:uncharacterized protein SPBR_00740 [Sporothrix brasiliensis 5110]KIH90211.1 hypothetical protein SPBR_00740 [Sporothrix brasiliensis 5110]